MNPVAWSPGGVRGELAYLSTRDTSVFPRVSCTRKHTHAVRSVVCMTDVECESWKGHGGHRGRPVETRNRPEGPARVPCHRVLSICYLLSTGYVRGAPPPPSSGGVASELVRLRLRRTRFCPESMRRLAVDG